ncbi:hypothetical protein CARUB_v10015022mg [Capsella rubella]|uniref:Uncharacterized protein n=1 Tax=Capsella rubella TaxID=81985 RepID=R0I1M4_9BRAS|nr:hypothetical protein CARUB_v10015022mg [Capsella rubella]
MILFESGLLFWFLQLENREGHDRNAESRMYLDGEILVNARRMHCEGIIVEFPRKVMAFIIRMQYLIRFGKKKAFLCSLFI